MSALTATLIQIGLAVFGLLVTVWAVLAGHPIGAISVAISAGFNFGMAFSTWMRPPQVSP